MKVDSEFAGLFVAVAFLVMGFVSMPIATWFVIGAIALGVLIALLLRFAPKRLSRVTVGIVIIFAVAGLWWAGRAPRRPHTVSSNALYVLPNNVPSRLHRAGYWLECWFDKSANVDRCKLTSEDGTVAFEDVFLSNKVGHAAVHQDALVFNTGWTAKSWCRSPDNRFNVPFIRLEYGIVLHPQSFDAYAEKDVRCSPFE
jgi:hypothetical protein